MTDTMTSPACAPPSGGRSPARQRHGANRPVRSTVGASRWPARPASRRRTRNGRWQLSPASPDRGDGGLLHSADVPPARAVVERAVGSQPSRGQPLRLTGRGRALVCLAVLGLVIAAFSVGRASSAESAGSPAATSTVVVQPGQTLWTIARDVDPTTDHRKMIDIILRLNPGRRGALHPGQTLVVPAR